MKPHFLAACAAALLLAPPAWSHGDAPAASKAAKGARPAEEQAFGKEGDPKKVTRTIKFTMADTMRYSPSEITVKRGETIRFEATNAGNVMHEIVFGTMQELKAHAALMQKHPGMEHDEPYMAHVAPKKTARVVWQFTKPGEFYFGCLIPGHFEAGMIGKVIVK